MSRKALPYKHISKAVDSTIQYLNDRRTGKVTSLRTGSPKLNKATLDGFEWNKIISVGGMSGSGKSLLAEQWKQEFIRYNTQPFKILSFEFEMVAMDQILRSLSSRAQLTTKELQLKKHTQSEFNALTKIAETMKSYPIYYVDDTGTVDEIEETILQFYEENIKNDEGLLVTIDHVLLTKGATGDAEKKVIDDLYKRIIKLKKQFSSNDQKILFLLLSQLNRGIESQDRIENPLFHYPDKNDLFGASSIYYSSDYVIITHKPARINGIEEYYGPPRKGYPAGLPVYNPEQPNQPMIYWHIIKNRGDTETTLMMLDNFANSRIDEYIPKKD